MLVMDFQLIAPPGIANADEQRGDVLRTKSDSVRLVRSFTNKALNPTTSACLSWSMKAWLNSVRHTTGADRLSVRGLIYVDFSGHQQNKHLSEPFCQGQSCYAAS
jgi:hypothetical protein